MGETVRIDTRAFNRGVNEVLKLKPIVRAINSAISHEGKTPMKNHPASKLPTRNEHKK